MFSSFLKDDKFATKWVDCYPIGNGNIGVMDYQGVKTNLMQLNNDTFWSGCGAKKHNTKCTPEILATIRQATLDGNIAQAQKLIFENILGGWTDCYITAGDMIITNDIENYEQYSRKLNMDNSLLTTEWSMQGKKVSTTSFVSYPDNVFVKKITSEIKTSSEITFNFPKEFRGSVKTAGNNIYLEIQSPSHIAPVYHEEKDPIVYNDEDKCLELFSIARIVTDGKISTKETSIKIDNYTSLIIYFTSKTSYLFDGDKKAFCEKIIDSAEKKGFDVIKQNHIADYQKLYKRVELSLNGKTSSPDNTSKSLKNFRRVADDALVVTLFDFGRYLTIAASRAGTQAANLQGIWNNHVRAPWSSNYTTNINAEMNYFGTDAVNLSECIEPLFTLMKKCSISGKITASETFKMGGWLLAHNSDLWGHSSPVGGESGPDACTYGLFIGGSGWILHHLFEHCLFANDTKMLNELLPYFAGACRFYLDYLSKDKNGNLVPNPSASPENTFFTHGGRYSVSTCSTMEASIIRTTFTNYMKAAKLVGINADFENEMQEALKLLKGYTVNKKGAINEWDADYRETDMRHRHVSHLYGLHPQYEITPEKTPELAKAANKTLKRRGLGGTGWSLAWKINMHARLKNGEKAYKLIRNQLRYIPSGDKLVMGGGGSYPSLLCAHPPFQIDGNFGAMAGIAEMLLQSHGDVIELLPAIPDCWKQGSVKGLKARGNYTVDITWDKRRVINYSISSTTAKKTKIKVKVNGTIEEYITK